MNFSSKLLENIVYEISQLPGIGRRSALRLALHILKENPAKINIFFEELGIDNLKPYFDSPSTLAKTFSLRGVPTTILLNSKGEEFARIIGSINFDNENFINWLKNLS